MSYKTEMKEWQVIIPQSNDLLEYEVYEVDDVDEIRFVPADDDDFDLFSSWIMHDPIKVGREQWLQERVSGNAVLNRFNQLSEHWEKEAALLSRMSDIVALWSYQQIIGMGPAVVPFILERLRSSPDYWFWALSAITGVDPVAESERGDLDAMSSRWIEWGRENSLI